MDQEDEDLQMALRMSMNEPPEPKRSKPRENVAGGGGLVEESPEKSRKSQRELMAAAAEKRMMAARNAAAPVVASSASSSQVRTSVPIEKEVNFGKEVSLGKEVNLGNELFPAEANQLFSMVFGAGVTKDILAQWSNQGIRYGTIHLII